MGQDDCIMSYRCETYGVVDSQALPFWIVWEDEEFIPCATKTEQSFKSGSNSPARRREQSNGKVI